MTRLKLVITGIFLLALIFTFGIVSAADISNLSVSKSVSSPGPFEIGQPITWNVTVVNNGPANATNISLKDSVGGFSGLANIIGSADPGTYDRTTGLWNISRLDNATSARLTIITLFNREGTQTNNIDILGLDQENYGNTHAEATIVINTAPEGNTANLSVSKTVRSAGPFETGQPVVWNVTLMNSGPANATNISLAESMPGFSGDIKGVASQGTYDNTTKIWKISQLDNATSAYLTIITVFESGGKKTNNIDILHLEESSYGNNHADAFVVINNAAAVIPDQPLDVTKAHLTIRPNTLNLKSKGVFTVFITLDSGDSLFPADVNSEHRIDSDSTLSCAGADMISAGVISNKDGGTLIAKFHRQDLENVTSGSGVQINCSGTLSVNGELVNVEGSDTIRVIGEKKGLDKFISGLMRYLGLEKDEIAVNETDTGNATVSFTLNPDDFRNNGQMKKALKTQNNSSGDAGNFQNISGKNVGSQKNAMKNNGKDKNSNGKGNVIQEDNAGNNGTRGNQNSNRDNDASNGKSNGKKDK
jgi:uncharacterized repeat protein (TIGR01451 family)